MKIHPSCIAVLARYAQLLSMLILILILSFFRNTGQAQSPGGVSTGLRVWYKGDAITPLANGTDMNTWTDSYVGDGAAQNAVQNGRNVLTYFGNRQPQYRTPVAQYNYYPFVDFTKRFSSLSTYQAHSTKPDYRFNYADGGTLYQVGAVTNSKMYNFGTGLGTVTGLIGGYHYESASPYYPRNYQYYGRAAGIYGGTVDDYGYYNFPFPPYNYNYKRKERVVTSGVPYINSVSFDKYSTYKTAGVVGTDATTVIQTRKNGDRWSWGYSYSPVGSALYIGNEYTNYNAGRWWKGGMPEVILYNRKLNTAIGDESDRVDTYLGLKYGISLFHSYYLSTGTKVWDTACDKTFNNDIAGLVRDNASSLNQKQSHSVNKRSTVAISLGNIVEFDNSANASSIADTYTLIWGSNASGGTVRDNRPLPGGFANLQANTQPNTMVPASCLTAANITMSKRKWMVQEQSGKDIGSVKVYVESKDLTCIDWTCANSYYIIVGTDANFTNPKYYPLSLATSTTGSTSDYVADINFCDGAPNASTTCGGLMRQYFAVVGIGSQCNCGGVSSGLTAWVRAENGKVFSDTATATLTNAEYGDNIRRVYNLSGLGDGYWKYDNLDGGSNTYNKPLYQATYGAPTVTSNFNPTIDFGSNIYPGFQFTNLLSRTSVSRLNNYNFTDTATAFASTYHNAFTASIETQVWGAGYTGGVPGFHVADGSGKIGGTSSRSGTIKYFPTVSPMVVKRNYMSGWSTALNGLPNVSTTYNLNIETQPIFKDTVYVNGKQMGFVTDYKYIGDNLNTQNRHNDLRLRGSRDLDPNLGDWPTSYNGSYAAYSLHDAIYYQRLLNDQEKDRIETYLAIRNGETAINAQYLASDATIIWDSTSYVDAKPDTVGYSRYNVSITGIGRDNTSCLVQKVSRNTVDTVVTIALNAIPESNDQEDIDADFENDKEFIVWGSNGASQSTSITTDMPSVGCLEKRFPREYRIHLTGANTGNYTTQVRWQLNNNILDAVSATSITLLIDDDGDGDFTTGTTRTVNATSFDPATNTIIFDNVTWSTTGDVNPSDAVMTVGWGETLIGKAKLYDNTANGGATCSCAGATVIATPICTDPSKWTYYRDNLNNRKVVAINWGTNTVGSTVTISSSTPAASRQKASLNVLVGGIQYDSSSAVGARMVNITQTSGTITTPVQVRFYYNPAEIVNDSTWVTSTSGVNEAIVIDSAWSWFKFEGTIPEVLSTLTATGLPIATDVSVAHPLQMEKLTPDEFGVEDGVSYVQFNNIISFSTFGYIQSYIKNSDLSVLPIGLKSFTSVKRNDCNATLFWTTASEQNSKQFDVQTSTDFGRSWETVGVVDAAKNSSTEIKYQLNVKLKSSQNNLFRLRMVDVDGKANYSAIQSLSCSGTKALLSVSPNPAITETYVTGFEAGALIKVINSEGKVLAAVKSSTNAYRVDVKAWPAGVYFIQVFNPAIDSYDVVKFVKP